MASKRRIRRRSCTSKVRYASELQAIAAAHSHRRTFGVFTMRAYLCKLCNGYHLGRPPHGWKQIEILSPVVVINGKASNVLQDAEAEGRAWIKEGCKQSK